jgi:hypothetical protein
MAGKLIVTLEIICGEGEPENYKGIMEAILEESDHWGDFDAKVVMETFMDDDTGEVYPLDFFDEK